MREWLLNMRKLKKLTQQNVADALGVTTQYYQMIESGKRANDLNTSIIMALATLFDVSAVELIRLEQEYHKKIKTGQ